ncbi:MAG: KpsF/GutQ family sugar-phosphate isomerase [Candidatus Marinimicrobia bacterium]|nr:KpsF/GutQ family sugar-phosphate isomerase [Candidatus Neomarinimicrobiota bacterium]
MKKDILSIARNVIRQEGAAVLALEDRIGPEFEKAVKLIYRCQGRVVVAGMGKSGQISRKIATTLASTGTPALYMHPSDGLHGDLGMLSRSDLLLLVSNSGETDDILRIMPTIDILGIPVVAILGRVDSTIGRKADVTLDASVEREACPMDLAPTTSTTAALAMGDALAMALLELRDFKPEDFALYHPGGALGKKLLTTVASLMHADEELPLIHKATPMHQAILVISEKGLGITGVIDDDRQLIGAITDGDLRRVLERGNNMMELSAEQVMTPNPKWILDSDLAVHALATMEDHAITSLFVMTPDDQQHPCGLIHIHDVLKTGIRR